MPSDHSQSLHELMKRSKWTWSHSLLTNFFPVYYYIHTLYSCIARGGVVVYPMRYGLHMCGTQAKKYTLYKMEVWPGSSGHIRSTLGQGYLNSEQKDRPNSITFGPIAPVLVWTSELMRKYACVRIHWGIEREHRREEGARQKKRSKKGGGIAERHKNIWLRA